MKQSLNKLIAMVLAVVTLSGLYVILMRDPPKTDKKPSESNDTTITQNEIQDISSVTVEFPLGQAFTVNVKPDGEIISYELVGGIDGVDYDQAKLESLVRAVSSLSAKEVEKNREKAKEYGFDEKSEKIKINYKDGKKDIIILGMDNANLGTYMLYNDEPKIYLLNIQSARQIKAEIKDYRSLQIINGISDITSEINRLYIDKFGSDKIKPFEIIRRPESEFSDEKATYYSAFVMKEPRQADAADDEFIQKILLPLSGGFTASEIAEDFPKNLSIYGLDKPVKIEIETESIKKTLLIGNESEEYRFVMLKDGSTVYKVLKQAFDFLKYDYRDYCTAVLWTHNINDISKMKVQYYDEVFETTLKHGENDSLTAETNGNTIEEEKARELFLKIISVRMEDELDKPVKNADIVASLELTYTNGKKYDIRFVKGAARQFIASVNGGEFINAVNISGLEEIMKLLD